MKKWLFFGFLLLIAIFVAAIAAFDFAAPTQVQSPNLQRIVSSNLLWGKQPISSTVGVNLAAFTSCAQEKAALDVVILIDASGSMDGDPLNNALTGARAFIDSLDFTQHQVSMATFDDRILEQTPLTPQKSDLLALLDRVSIGPNGTSLSTPLSFARAELESRRRQFDSIPIVLLFSDGAASDADKAVTTSHQIQDLGGQVFVVGLRNQDFQQNSLEAIASSPDNLLVAPTSAELVKLFTDIGEIVNSFVLRDVRFVEPLSFDDWDVVLPNDGKVQDSVSIGPEGIAFQFDAMTSQDAAEFGSFHYQSTPKRYGLIKATPTESNLDLVACSAQIIHETLAVGPSLLVLPPLPFVAPILLALLLLAALPWLFGRKRIEGQTPIKQHRDDMPHPVSSDPDPMILTWLRNAENLSEERALPGDGLANTPHLIIGLGEAGRVVMHQIVERVSERVGDRWPNNLRLLQISFPRDDGKTTTQQELPRTVEQVVLKRDIGRQNLEGDHMAWSRGNSAIPRNRGRMALFTDLSNGKNESILWEPLGRVLNNQKNITVWIISDSFGSASGVIADLAHLIRVRVNGEIVNSVRLCVATHNADWSAIASQSGKEAASFATIRELQRLQSSEETPFIYTSMSEQQELRATHRGKLLDEIYLFDGYGEKPEDGSPYDISKFPAEKGVLRVIANAMLALLETPISTAFYMNERNAQTALARGGGVDLENYGSVMGCAVIRAPIEQSRRLAELRLLHRALFDPTAGIFGWGILDAEDKQMGSPVASVSISSEDHNAFQRDVGKSARTDEYFQQLLLEYLVRRMNDGRPLALRWAEEMLKWLAGQNYPATPVQAVRNEIQRWSRLITEQGSSGQASASTAGRSSLASFSFDMSKTASPSARVSPTTSISLTQQWQEQWNTAKDAFPTAGENEPEQIAWTIADERTISKRYFDRESERIAARIRGRTFWHWSVQPSPQLRLVILPPVSLSAPHADGGSLADDVHRRPHAYSVGADDPVTLMRQLVAAVRPFSQALRQESGALVTMLQNADVQKRLDQNASPLYAQVERGKERVASPYMRYLLQPSSLPSDLHEVHASHRLSGSDPTICTLLHAQHSVRFGNMRSYSEARSTYQSNPDIFVFLAEQEAARRERAARGWAQRNQSLILSPTATALLDRNAEIFDLVGKLFVRGDLELSQREIDGVWMSTGTRPETQPVVGPVHDVPDKLSAIFPTSAQQAAIRQLIQERPQGTSRRARLALQLPELTASQNAGERDVAIMIAWALENPE